MDQGEMSMKKHICILLMMALLCANLVACATTEEKETENTPQESSQVETETAEEDVYAALLAEVPTADYDGYTFLMMNNESDFAYTLMTAEELNGESINDAVYNRNVAVAD